MKYFRLKTGGKVWHPIKSDYGSIYVCYCGYIGVPNFVQVTEADKMPTPVCQKGERKAVALIEQ